MLAAKARGEKNWYHPAAYLRNKNKDKDGQYHPGFRAKRAATGFLFWVLTLYAGSRPASVARAKEDDTEVPLPNEFEEGLGRSPPVWVLGLAGLVEHFQLGYDTGGTFYNTYVKYTKGGGCDEVVDFLPPGMGGVCLLNCINFAFQILFFLQPQDPTKVVAMITKGDKKAGIPDKSEDKQNNPSGYCFPYNRLQYVTEEEADKLRNAPTGDGLAEVVDGALSSLNFVTDCFMLATIEGEYSVGIGRVWGISIGSR